MKKTKKLLALFVSLCMVLSMLPVTAWAADGDLKIEGAKFRGQEVKGTCSFSDIGSNLNTNKNSAEAITLTAAAAAANADGGTYASSLDKDEGSTDIKVYLIAPAEVERDLTQEQLSADNQVAKVLQKEISTKLNEDKIEDGSYLLIQVKDSGGTYKYYLLKITVSAAREEKDVTTLSIKGVSVADITSKTIDESAASTFNADESSNYATVTLPNATAADSTTNKQYEATVSDGATVESVNVYAAEKISGASANLTGLSSELGSLSGANGAFVSSVPNVETTYWVVIVTKAESGAKGYTVVKVTVEAKPAPEALNVTVAAAEPAQKGHVKLTVSGGTATDYYYQVIDNNSPIDKQYKDDTFQQGDSKYTKADAAISSDGITVEAQDGKYIEVYGVTDNKVVSWGVSGLTEDNYTPALVKELTLEIAADGTITVTNQGSETLKYGVTSDDSDPSATVKAWTVETEETTAQESISDSFQTCNSGSTKLTAADNGKYLIVVEVNSGNTLVAAGSKLISGIKSTDATLKSLNIGSQPAGSDFASPGTTVDAAKVLTAVTLGDLTSVKITATPTATVSSIKYMIKEGGSESTFTEDGTMSGSGAGEYTVTTAVTENHYIYIEVTAEDGNTKGYYKVQVKKGAEKPQVIVSPTEINAGTKDPTVTLTCSNIDFTSTTGDDYGFSAGSTGLTLAEGSPITIGGDKRTVTVKLTGTAKTGSFTFTVAQNAFGVENASGAADVQTVEVKAVKPVISVSPTTINVGTEATAITLTVTSNLPFKSGAQKTDLEVTPTEETGLTVGEVTFADTTATIKFTSEEGAAKAGSITIQAKDSAYDNMASEASNTVTVTVSTPSSGSTTPSTSVKDPATDTTTGETTVDVNTGSTLSGTTANATVSGANMDKAVESAVTEAAKQDTAPVVEVNVDTSSRADGINVTLPADSLDKLAQAEGSSLKITSDVAEVEMDNTALAALAEQADTTAVLSVTPAKDMNEAQTEAAGTAPVVDVTVTSGGKTITDYHGGILLITLPYKLPAGHDEASVVVFYLDDAGKLTACATSYKDGKVTFLTKHLSKYVIGSTDMNEVTLTATTTLAAGASGGEIVLTATGSAFAESAAAASFTLSDSALTVSAVKVSGATATLTVTGTPTATGTLTVTAKKDAFDPAAAADATATVTVAEAAPAPTPTTVTLTATSTLAVGVNGGTITLTTDGAAFADPAVATNFTLSDTALTVTGVVVKDNTATLTVTGTPAESETVTVTVKKEAFAAAEADASVKLSVSLFTFDFTFETSMVEGKLVLTVGIEVYLRGNLLLTIPVEIPLS